MKFGYARVSTDGQSVEAQVRALTKAGCKKVLREVASGAKTDRYFWGVIAASVTVAIISLLNGLNRLTFVAMAAALVAMLVFYCGLKKPPTQWSSFWVMFSS
jgi:predicted site-specific integrase-resolvase